MMFGFLIYLTFGSAFASIPVVEVEVPPPAIAPSGLSQAVSYYTGADWPEGQIAITVDDGPHPVYTPKLLDILKKYGIRATFFLVGEMAEIRAPIVQRELQEGHTIGTHSYRHPNFSSMTVDAALAEFKHGVRAVRAALGEEPAPFFRFPYLDGNAANRMAIAREGYNEIGWNSVNVVDHLAPVNGHRRRGILIAHDMGDEILHYLPPFLDQMEKYGYTAAVLVKPRDLSVDDGPFQAALPFVSIKFPGSGSE